MGVSFLKVNMERGWVKIYRKIQDNPFWDEKPFTKGQAWIDLLLLSNHKDNFFFVRGIKVEVKRGQVGWSEVRLADKWGWSRTKLRGFLKHLENEGQIEQQKNNVSLLITIRNFEEYQGKEQQKNSRKTAERQQKDTNKNEKNEKNEKKSIYGEFKNVKLTDEEHSKLKEKFNGSFTEKIEKLSLYIESKGVKYKSHYATILSWARKENNDSPQQPEYKQL